MAQKLNRLLRAWLSLRLVAFMRSTSPAPVRRARAGVDETQDAASSDPWPDLARLLISWLALLLLGGGEFAISYISFGRALRPLLMIPAFLMAAVVAINFMEVGKGPTIVRGFAVAAMFWLMVLLALGSMDPLTRTNYPVPHAQVR